MKPTCPICQAPLPPRAENPAYPFCSTRCQNLDLGRWLSGDYRIPGEPLEDIGSRDGEPAGRPEPADPDDPDGDWLA